MAKMDMDKGKILDGLAQGKSQEAIAQDLGVNQSSISRFMAKIKPYFEDVQNVTINRGNVLNVLHSKSLNIVNSCLDELERQMKENDEKAVKERMDHKEILWMLRGVGVNQAILYDKMRLEGGQSTQNHSLAGMVAHFHENVGFFDASTGRVKASITQAPAHALKQKIENQSNQPLKP